MPDRIAQLAPATPLLIAVGALAEFAKSVLGLYGELLHTDPALLLVACTAWFLDIPLGLLSSYRQGRRFDQAKAQGAFIKLVRYCITIPFAVLVANAPPDGVWYDFLGWFDEAVLMAIIYLEGRSVLRHLWGDELKGLLDAIRTVARIGGKGSDVLEALEKDEDEKVKV